MKLSMIATAAALLPFTFSAWAGPTASVDFASAVEVQGKAWAVQKKERRELKTGDTLREGEAIETGDDGNVTLKLKNTAAVLVKPRTELTIEHPQKKDWMLHLKRGGVLSSVKNPEKRPNHFRIRTKAAVMGVRGTTFFVQTEPSKPVFLCTCAGTVSVTDSEGQSSITFTSKHHDSPKRIEQGRETLARRLTNAPVGTDHLDAEAERLAQLLAP